MEITNFSGRPIEIIKYYISSFNVMDEQTKNNFSNLVMTLINGSDILSLIDLYSNLDLDVTNEKNKIDTLTLELVSIKGKMESDIELEQLAQSRGTTRGDEILRLNNEYKVREEKLKTAEHIEGMSFGICSIINETIINKIQSLSVEKRETLLNVLSDKLKIQEDRVNTLSIEMISRKGKMESDIELDQIAQSRGITRGDVLVDLNREYRERWIEVNNLEHSVGIYNKYSEVIYNISKQK